MKDEIVDTNLVKANNYTKENLESLIYTIRGKQVILDSDIALLFRYKTKALNLAVKRNFERFPEDFCFRLTEEELINLRFQIETSKNNLTNVNKRGGNRYLPYAFTEQGVAMLAGILNSDIAIKMSIQIIRTFIEMRKFLLVNGQVFDRLTKVEYKLLEQDEKIDILFNSLNKENEFKQRIFFEGQIYDAYSVVLDIIKKATKEIAIIDNYVDENVLKILTKKNKNVKVYIFTTDKSSILPIDIQKFNKEYPKIKVTKTNKFHDRFLIIDNSQLYHLGASIKDLGKKCFAISKIEDSKYIEELFSVNKQDQEKKLLFK